MFNNTKQALFGSKKEDASAAPSRLAKAQEEGATFVPPEALNDSYKYLGYMGDTALAGIGAGMSWYALKKLVEYSYRKRLEKAIRKTTDVTDFYKSKTAPITNAYVGAPKTAAFQKSNSFADDIPISRAQSDNSRFSTDISQDLAKLPGKTQFVAVSPNQGLLSNVATTMASNPLLFNTLAFVSLPAILAGSVWAGNSMSKAINDRFKSKDIRRMTKEKEEARKRYEDAAMTLRNITLGGINKESAAREKQAGLLTLGLLGGLLGTAALGTGAAYYASNPPMPKKGTEDIYVPNPYPFKNKLANGLASAGVGALGLMAVPSAYRFVQSMRKGYKNQVEGISDVTRAAQAWNAVRDSRGEDFATLRASLADEPDLLDFESHGTKKKRKK